MRAFSSVLGTYVQPVNVAERINSRYPINSNLIFIILWENFRYFKLFLGICNFVQLSLGQDKCPFLPGFFFFFLGEPFVIDITHFHKVPKGTLFIQYYSF